MSYKAKGNEAHFRLKVDKNGPIDPRTKSQCWLWTGATGKGGYGTLNGKLGARIATSKLDDLSVTVIRTMRAACPRGSARHVPNRLLAKWFGIHETTIERILSRRTWASAWTA